MPCRGNVAHLGLARGTLAGNVVAFLETVIGRGRMLAELAGPLHTVIVARVEGPKHVGQHTCSPHRRLPDAEYPIRHPSNVPKISMSPRTATLATVTLSSAKE